MKNYKILIINSLAFMLAISTLGFGLYLTFHKHLPFERVLPFYLFAIIVSIFLAIYLVSKMHTLITQLKQNKIIRFWIGIEVAIGALFGSLASGGIGYFLLGDEIKRSYSVTAIKLITVPFIFLVFSISTLMLLLICVAAIGMALGIVSPKALTKYEKSDTIESEQSYTTEGNSINK